MSSKTKTLIDLQTFKGCFVLDSVLATLLGVSILSLEARLMWFVPDDASLNLELRKNVWATMLAIKLFEMQLERLDKARGDWVGWELNSILLFLSLLFFLAGSQCFRWALVVRSVS